MTKLLEYAKPMGFGNPLTPGSKKSIVGNAWKSLIMGTPESQEKISNLRPEQEEIATQAINAAKGRGAGGAFGDTADYYRNLLSDESADFNAFAAPQLRQYNEDIMPGISEQFAGMGAGGLSSSGFRNAQIQGATDLSERLGQIRANLRQSGAQGLQSIGQQGLQQFDENILRPGTEGLIDYAAPALGAAATAFGGPALGAAGTAAGSWLTNKFGTKSVGRGTSPYGQGGGYKSSPTFSGGDLQSPTFLQGQGVRGF